MPKLCTQADADKLFAEAFAPDTHRDSRSIAYKNGVRAAIEKTLRVRDRLACPYKVGTAQADAWFSGREEGRRIADKYLEIEGMNDRTIRKARERNG